MNMLVRGTIRGTVFLHQYMPVCVCACMHATCKHVFVAGYLCCCLSCYVGQWQSDLPVVPDGNRKEIAGELDGCTT